MQKQTDKKINRYREAVEKAKRLIVEWNRSGVIGWFQVSTYTKEIDHIVRSILKEAFKITSPSYSVVALGGYGRKELNLCSDLDIMFLWQSPLSEKEEESINLIVQMLWDLGLDVGHALRSVDEAIILAREDEATRCSYIDSRLLGGSLNPYLVFTKRLTKGLLGQDPSGFFRTMEEWLEERHNRYSSSMYLLEPNVKEGPGCLRDIHTCFWTAKEIYQIKSFADLKRKGLITPLEYETLREARDFLWRVRNAIHDLRNRKNDILTIDIQPTIAHILGYRDVGKLLGVEYFMKDFYTHLKNVRRVTKAFLMRTKEELFPHLKPTYMYIKTLLEERYETPGKFLKEVIRLSRSGASFEEFYKGFWIPPLHWRERDIYSDETREAFKELLNLPESYRVLNFLHEIGFIERIIPEFSKVTGLMQFDLYHKFTVDEHTLLAIKNVETLPQQTDEMYQSLKETYQEILASGKKYLLMLALLLHDIGKGKGGGHAIRGARTTAEIMEKMGFSEEETELVTFLVKHHTVMAETAFRKDVNDVKTVASFASLMEDEERLKMLYVLTYGDVSAISPDSWNEWKAYLLAFLFENTKKLLKNEIETKEVAAISLSTLADEIHRKLRKRISKSKVKEIIQLIPEDKLISLPPELVAIIVEGMLEAEKKGFSIKWHTENSMDTPKIPSKLVVVNREMEGAFTSVVGIISSRRLNIQSAHLIKCLDGTEVYTVDITRPNLAPLTDSLKKEELEKALVDALKGRLDVEEELKKKHIRLSKKERVVHNKTKIRLNNTTHPIYTALEVKTQDRLGLLYLITKELLSMGLELHMATVSTEGNRAVDTFFVTKDGKKLKEYQFPEIVRTLKKALD